MSIKTHLVRTHHWRDGRLQTVEHWFDSLLEAMEFSKVTDSHTAKVYNDQGDLVHIVREQKTHYQANSSYA